MIANPITYTDEQVERVARAIYETASGPWEFASDYGQDIVRREARAAIAALPPQGDGWQDIASAPRDGTRVLLERSFPDSTSMRIAFWHDGQNTPCFVWSHDGRPVDLRYFIYWRPLPAPPAAEIERTKP